MCSVSVCEGGGGRWGVGGGGGGGRWGGVIGVNLPSILRR